MKQKYTEEDFLRYAREAGLLDQLSAADLLTARESPEFGMSLASLKKDWANAGTGRRPGPGCGTRGSRRAWRGACRRRASGPGRRRRS